MFSASNKSFFSDLSLILHQLSTSFYFWRNKVKKIIFVQCQQRLKSYLLLIREAKFRFSWQLQCGTLICSGPFRKWDSAGAKKKGTTIVCLAKVNSTSLSLRQPNYFAFFKFNFQKFLVLWRMCDLVFFSFEKNFAQRLLSGGRIFFWATMFKLDQLATNPCWDVNVFFCWQIAADWMFSARL